MRTDVICFNDKLMSTPRNSSRGLDPVEGAYEESRFMSSI